MDRIWRLAIWLLRLWLLVLIDAMVGLSGWGGVLEQSRNCILLVGSSLIVDFNIEFVGEAPIFHLEIFDNSFEVFDVMFLLFWNLLPLNWFAALKQVLVALLLNLDLKVFNLTLLVPNLVLQCYNFSWIISCRSPGLILIRLHFAFHWIVVLLQLPNSISICMQFLGHFFIFARTIATLLLQFLIVNYHLICLHLQTLRMSNGILLQSHLVSDLVHFARQFWIYIPQTVVVLSCDGFMIFQTNIFRSEIHIFSIKLLTLALLVHNVESFVWEGSLHVLLLRSQFIDLLLLILKETGDFLELSICSHWLISSRSGLICSHFAWWNSGGVANCGWARIWHSSGLLEILWAISGRI